MTNAVAVLKQFVQKQGRKGAFALVSGAAIGIFALLGLGLILAALLMALATLIGVIWASFALGIGFLALALIIIGKKPRPAPKPEPQLGEIIFTLGFLAARVLLRPRS